MKALNERMRNQAEANTTMTAQAKSTPKDRQAHLEKLQYVDGKEIFAVQYSSIHKAAIDGSVDAIKHFLSGRGRKKGKAGVNSKVECNDWDVCKMSPIHYAGERGYNHIISALVEKGADIDFGNGNGMTASHFAAKMGHDSTLIFILDECGGNLFAKNSGGMSIAHYAIQCDHVEILKVLVERFTRMLQLMISRVEELELIALNGGEAAIGDPLEGSEDIEKPEGTLNIEQLRIAMNTQDEEASEDDILAEVMKMQPEDILNMPSLSGCTCLHLCGEFGSIKCLEYLISLKLDMNSQDSIGETPMHKAGRKNFFEVYNTMKAAGGSDQLKNLLGETPHQVLHDETLY